MLSAKAILDSFLGAVRGVAGLRVSENRLEVLGVVRDVRHAEVDLLPIAGVGVTIFALAAHAHAHAAPDAELRRPCNVFALQRHLVGADLVPPAAHAGDSAWSTKT